MNYRHLPALLFLFAHCFTAHAQDAAEPTLTEKITAAAKAHRERLEYDGRTFSGPAWDRLLTEGKKAQFFLIGEEHGIAENPKLAARLFEALVPSGYSNLAIEISPPVATLLDLAIHANGLDGLREHFAKPGAEPAFFGMAEEAELLAAARAAVKTDAPMLWGVDYEVAGFMPLFDALQAATKPAAAADALQELRAAADASWKKYKETGGPQFIFSFDGDPALVRAVRDAWPNVDARSDSMLHTLEETLQINQLWIQGRAWESNERRSAFIRDNFLRRWRAAKTSGHAPKVMAKFGASHMVRGRNMSEVFDLGTLLPELAGIEGSHSFSVMVVPGANSMIAALDPSAWQYNAVPAAGGYSEGISAVTTAAYEDTFTLIDLRKLRPVVGWQSGDLDKDLFRVIHGFDMLLVMSGSTASGELEHD